MSRTNWKMKMMAMSKLSEKLGSGKPVVTAACIPPHATDATAVKKLAACFPPSLDGVIVGDHAEQSHGSALACAVLLAAEKIEPVLSLCTRDRNRVALESDVLGASALGVKTFFCMSGMHQALGGFPQAAGAYDMDSVQLTQALAKMASAGLDFSGSKLPATPALTVAAAAHPYLRPIELAVRQTKKKIAAGAQILLTDPIFDLAGFEEWLKAVRAAGLDKQAAIIASVLPLTSVAQAEELRTQPGSPISDDILKRLRSGDAAQAGVAIAAEIAGKAKAMAGVRGIHIHSAGCEPLAAAVIKEARLA
jgi:methylenetetrahydrofolate reductase (NADPH)